MSILSEAIDAIGLYLFYNKQLYCIHLTQTNVID